MRARWAMVAGAIAVLVAPVLGHHSFGALYLEDDRIEIEGEILEFQYKNPHSWVHVAAADPATGRLKTYSAEWVGTSRLEREGITKDTLKAGDSVRIWGAPNRNPTDTRIHLKRIKRRDGWEWGQTRPEQR